MARGAKILLTLLCVLLLISAGLIYYRSFISMNFLLAVETECNSKSEQNCFSFELEDGELYFYKILEANARQIKDACGVNVSDCDLSCAEIGSSCRYITCNDPEGHKFGECSLNSEVSFL